MLKKNIIEDIFLAATKTGIQNSDCEINYENTHIAVGEKFINELSDLEINNFIILVDILKEYGYWTENIRYIGGYTNQPKPYNKKPHISIKKNNIDVARICFVIGGGYFGVSFFKEALISNCKHAINDSAAYQNVAYRWAPQNIKHFLENPSEYIKPYDLI